MKILAIDTSTKYLSLAIAKKDKIIASFHRDLEQQHCERLIPEIDRLLKKAKLKLRDIDCIAFSIGPGSFTGLRIGAATIKGLTLATKIKIAGVPTLDVLAYNVKESGKLIVPVVDAKRGNVYASIYSFSGGKLRRRLKYSVLPITELLRKIKGDAIFLGDGLIPYKKTIEDNFKFKAAFAAEKDWHPRVATVAKLGYELAKKKRFEEPDKFVPMYLYPKDVQVRGKMR
ncbi:MAG: tRNA (adenosine(37)-N6)-threonylcarbamoyltransferase complex dimerization subunit type 1 TsaB [Candidatus Omnitrophota bacterium]|nr:tRNA (adenosine(37)-N6)-threonylcarbamoyltransferase complex dimerization subunit type 1 TsaB [Candidatus Omnitrophota bacterium]